MKKVLGLVWEKFCDAMIGLDNLSGKLVYADKIFAKKPQTLGEGLARIKKKFGIVEQKKPLIPNERTYLAKDGSNVHFFNSGKGLYISKEVPPVSEKAYNKVFAYEPAKIEKGYFNINLGDAIHMDRSINVSYFKPIKNAREDVIVATHNIDRPGVRELKYNDFYRDHYHNTREIPYAMACARGMKV